jgi:catechol 2,3-dioxygenase-like lactoylglutathione lyase family enzyme
MIDHVSVSVRSLAGSAAFYEAVLGALGMVKLVERPTTIGFGARYSEFWIHERPAMAPVANETGCHTAFRVRTPEEVEHFHAAALAFGGTDDGPPGKRQYSRASVFAAFVRDPDGNRIEAVALLPE